MTNLLVEGGPAILGSFFDAQAVDEVWAFIAPKWIGNTAASSPFNGSISYHLSHQPGERCDP